MPAGRAIAPAPSLQPRSTLIIDCGTPEGELLAAMHGKTRYNIRLAERHGVAVRDVPAAEAIAGFERWWPLFTETSRRERFSLHPPAHYRILLETASDDFSNELWVAELGGVLLAAAVVNFYRPAGVATYLHGASSREQREAMPSHLLHWRIIQAAAERGYRSYDLGGIDEVRWPGVARFKHGFGGRIVTFPPSFDVVFRPWLYRLYRFQRRVRRRGVTRNQEA